jgi:hypothetical protein
MHEANTHTHVHTHSLVCAHIHTDRHTIDSEIIHTHTHTKSTRIDTYLSYFVTITVVTEELSSANARDVLKSVKRPCLHSKIEHPNGHTLSISSSIVCNSRIFNRA